MNEQNSQKKPRKIRFRLILILLLACYAVITFVDQTMQIRELKNQEETLMKEKAAAEKKYADLQEEIENLNTPEYIEKVAREELGLVKQGESVFIDANGKSPSESETVSDKETETKEAPSKTEPKTESETEESSEPSVE